MYKLIVMMANVVEACANIIIENVRLHSFMNLNNYENIDVLKI